MQDKKYFWLKLNKDFFKQHEIRIIEETENGKDYILFYLKLLVESISHEGNLRFNDTIPYNDKMLATITNTNIDIVRSAIKVFTELKLMEVLDDGTIYMTETIKMIGTASGTESAIKKREYRLNKRLENTLLDKPRTKCPTEIELEKDIEIEIYKFKKPTIEEIKSYCKERNNNVNGDKFYDFYESKGWKIGKNSMKDWKACVRTWEQDKVSTTPSWYGKDIKKEEMTEQEIKELEETMKGFE